MSAAQKCQTLVYYANALFQLDQFKNSEQAFYRALQVRRALTKTTESKRDQVVSNTGIIWKGDDKKDVEVASLLLHSWEFESEF